jgi:hypothetical protein
MEHIHLQTSINGLWGNETPIGVPVFLTAIGSDGSVYDIGQVTTNGYYGTFSQAWTPPKEDTYQIIASFAGDESYGSSAASTAVSVGPATPEIIIPEQPAISLPPTETYIIGATIAIIIAIAIVGMLILKKKQ